MTHFSFFLVTHFWSDSDPRVNPWVPNKCADSGVSNLFLRGRTATHRLRTTEGGRGEERTKLNLFSTVQKWRWRAAAGTITHFENKKNHFIQKRKKKWASKAIFGKWEGGKRICIIFSLSLLSLSPSDQ